MKLFVLAVVLAVPGIALAQSPAPGSIADCERIKGDLAYNQCLANFGPARGERRSRVAAPAGEDDEPAVRRGGRRGNSGYRTRRRGGRQSAAFEVGGARVQSGKTTRAARGARAQARYSRRRR
jgi:hypothetical protein